jgi:hypothetical protein
MIFPQSLIYQIPETTHSTPILIIPIIIRIIKTILVFNKPGNKDRTLKIEIRHFFAQYLFTEKIKQGLAVSN